MTAQTPFPLPRQLRESTLNVGDGTAGPYGPSTYRIWDVADVKIFARAQGEEVFTEVTGDCTIAKTAGEPFDTFSVTFGAAIPSTTDWYSQARRTHERQAAIAQGGALSGLEMEKELSRQATVLSELRRDADRALKVDLEFDGALELPVLGDAQTLLWDAEAKRFRPGPTMGEIEQAAAQAQAAAASAASAAGSAAAAGSALLDLRERYLGAFASDEAALGAAGEGGPVVGTLYFNTTDHKFRVWTGAAFEHQDTSIPDGSIAEEKLSSTLRSRLVGAVVSVAALAALTGSTYAAVDLYEAGRKGLFVWDASNRSAEVTADTRQAIYVAPTSDASGASGAWVRQYDGAADLKWWRPAKDGATDDTAVLAEAIAYVSAADGTLKVGRGDYAVDGLTLKSNVHVKLAAGTRLIQPDAGTVTAGYVLYGTGTVNTGAAVALTANFGANADTLTVASGGTAGFSVGDWVLVYDDDYVFPSTAGRNQEVMQVLSKTTTTLTFSRYVTTAFTTANNAKVAPLLPLENVCISGPGEVVVGINRAFGISLTYPVNCRISDGVTVRRPRAGGALVFQTGYNSHIKRCSVQDASVQTSGLGYGTVFDESCVFCTVTDCHIVNVRENTFTNRTRHCVFARNRVVKVGDTGWNTHGAGCSYNTCEDNLIEYCALGVGVGWSGAARADSNNLVQNNRIIGCASGISVNHPSTQVAGGNVVKGNEVERATGIGILCQYSNTGEIVDNVVRNSTLTNAVQIETCSDLLVGKNVAKDIVTAGGGIGGFRVSGGTRVNFIGNTAMNISGSGVVPFYVPAGNTSCALHHNTLLNAGTVSVAGASGNTLNTWN